MLCGKKQILVSIDGGGEVRRRISIQDAQSVWRGAGPGSHGALGDDVSRKWQPGLRVRELYGLAVENIGRIQQFTEVPRAHLQSWNSGRRVCVRKDIPHPFLAPVPENLGLVGVEVIWNVQRSADVISELVVVDWCCNMFRCRNRIALPGIGVKHRVAHIFVSRSMEILSASLRGNPDLSSGRPPK